MGAVKGAGAAWLGIVRLGAAQTCQGFARLGAAQTRQGFARLGAAQTRQGFALDPPPFEKGGPKLYLLCR